MTIPASASHTRDVRLNEMLLGALFCAVFTLALHVPWLSQTPLAGTEGHRALTAHQMVQSGDWVVPRLYGRTYLRKPPLHYWIIASVESVAGHANEFVWRLPSSVMASLSAATVALFGFRWFGRIGGWVAGFSFAGLIVLWSQSRTADIDSTNTLACTLAALAMVELLFNQPRRPLTWSLLAGAALGATLMTKGPAGLPPIAGVLLFAAVARRRQLARWPLVVSLLIGVALFASWALAVYLRFATHGQPQDVIGLNEGIDNLYPDSALRIAKALLVPVLLFVYSLPLSLAIPLACMFPLDRPGADDQRLLRVALAKSVLLSWAVCVASGMVNERYGSVTLPMLCPLAGGVVAGLVAIWRNPDRRSPTIELIYWRNARLTLSITVGGMSIACIAIAVIALRIGGGPNELLIAAMVSGAMFGILGVISANRNLIRTSSIALCALLATLSIPFGVFMNQDRPKRSGYAAAQLLKPLIPPGAAVTMGAMLRYQPELFYYANLNARSYAEAVRAPDQLPGETWLILSDEKPEFEYRHYLTAAGARLGEVTPFQTNKKQAYLVHLLPNATTAP